MLWTDISVLVVDDVILYVVSMAAYMNKHKKQLVCQEQAFRELLRRDSISRKSSVVCVGPFYLLILKGREGGRGLDGVKKIDNLGK